MPNMRRVSEREKSHRRHSRRLSAKGRSPRLPRGRMCHPCTLSAPRSLHHRSRRTHRVKTVGLASLAMTGTLATAVAQTIRASRRYPSSRARSERLGHEQPWDTHVRSITGRGICSRAPRSISPQELRDYVRQVGYGTAGSFDVSDDWRLHGPCTAWCRPRGGKGCSTNVKPDDAPSFKQCATGDYCAYGTFINQCIMMPETHNPQVRVAKAYGSRGYNKVRISLISRSSSYGGGPNEGFVYDEDFKFRWPQFRLSSSLLDVTLHVVFSLEYEDM